jgi:hypothetical protein
MQEPLMFILKKNIHTPHPLPKCGGIHRHNFLIMNREKPITKHKKTP